MATVIILGADHGYLPTYLNVLFWLEKPSARLCFDQIGLLVETECREKHWIVRTLAYHKGFG